MTVTQERLIRLLGPTPKPLGDPWNKVWRAVVLSPTLETCIAMLSGQRVPVSSLDPLWARRFGIR